MNQQEFCNAIYPLYEAGQFQAFIDEYDRLIELLGGINYNDSNLHIIAHGHRVLRWSALEQISDKKTLSQDIQKFLNAQATSDYTMELICGLIMDQSMERLLPLLEENSPTPLRIIKAMRYRLAQQSNDIDALLKSLKEFDALPAAGNERDVRIILPTHGIRFNQDDIESLHLSTLPDNNGYIEIQATRDGNTIDVSMPLPGNNSICAEGHATLLVNGAETGFTLTTYNSSNSLLVSPYGYDYEDDQVKIMISNLRLWE